MLSKVKFKMREHLPKSQKSSRLIKVFICFMIAFALTASIFMAQQTQNTVVMVVKSKEIIEEGTKIKDTDLTPVEVGEYGLPDGVIVSKDEAIGKYAKSAIYPSDYITPDKLTSKHAEPFTTLKTNQKIMAFTVSNLAASVASNIEIGDTIQVIYSETIADETGINVSSTIITPDCLKKLTVIDIRDANGYTENTERTGSAKLYAASSFIPSVITVAVSDEQAAELYKAELTKNIYAIFVER